MATFVVRRLLISIPVFFGITMLVFLFVALAPGSRLGVPLKPELATNPAARELVSPALRPRPADPDPLRPLADDALQGDLGYRAMEAAGRHRGLARPDASLC